MTTLRIARTAIALPTADDFLARLRLWFAVWNERRALSELDEHARRDIGLTEGMAYREATRPFWDIAAMR